MKDIFVELFAEENEPQFGNSLSNILFSILGTSDVSDL